MIKSSYYCCPKHSSNCNIIYLIATSPIRSHQQLNILLCPLSHLFFYPLSQLLLDHKPLLPPVSVIPGKPSDHSYYSLFNLQKEITDALEKVCSVLPRSLSSRCSAFVDQYGPVIIQLLANQLDPQQVCSFIKMCVAG